MKYHTAFFDLDGTLLDYKKSEANALSSAFRKLFQDSFPPDIIPVYHGINTVLWEKYEKGEITNEFLRVERFRQLFSHYHIHGDPEEFSSLYLGYLAEGGYLLSGAVALLESLNGAIRLAALTNGITGVQQSRLSISGIGKYFEQIAISDTEGVAKPDKRIFEILMQRMGLESTEGILMIGDSLSSDIQGGINAGIDTCWFNPGGKDPGDITPDYTTATFNEIALLLVSRR